MIVIHHEARSRLHRPRSQNDAPGIETKSDTAVVCSGLNLPRDLNRSALNGAEHSSLNFYANSLAPQLDSKFKCSVWQKTALQLSVDAPFVLNAILSLSSIYKARTVRRNSALYDRELQQLALVQHGKALAELRRFLESISSDGFVPKEVLPNVLMTCLLFVSFDLLLGERSLATSQFCQGLRLLHSQPQTDYVELQKVFEELDGGFSYPRTQALPPWSWAQLGFPESAIPQNFDEASLQLDLIVTALYQVRDTVFSNVRAAHQTHTESMSLNERQVYEMCAASITRPLLDTAVSNDLQRLRSHLTAWSNAFERLTRHDAFGIHATVRMTFRSFHAKFLLSWLDKSASSLCYDEFSAEFAFILDLALQYLASGPAQRSSSDRCLRAGPEVLVKVYWTGLRCRDPTIRRRALRILQDAKHYSDWTGHRPLALALEVILNFEETEAMKFCEHHDITHAADIPEQARVHDMKIVADPERPQVFRLIFGRCGSDGKVELFQETLEYREPPSSR